MSLHDGLPQVRFAHRFLSSHPVIFHEHPCLELVFVTRGSCVIRVNKTPLTGQRGDVFLLPARAMHDQVATGTGTVGTLYIGFMPGAERVDELPQVIPTAGDPYIRNWIKSIVDLNRDSETPSPVVVGGLLTALLARLRSLQRRVATPAVTHPKVDAAVDYIRQHLCESLSVAALAQAVGVSPSHLRTLFRHHVGLSPQQYQKSLRMNLARQRLADPYPSIKEVAVECGYHDVNLFIRLFRKQHGQAPGRWRHAVANRD